ncbi:MAG: type I-C CRISPR-associated protein Cas8c/Csd1 [Deltaproteobacteria bacterium]|jgi:CRISPR-associated protein Csd1|nr:type I-C CRISPR-associated protein Cas8c/Csd1 [Deltaproteobacteria bacterium]
MSWFQKLYATYEHCADNPAFAGDKSPLCPVGHISQQAHILVTINGRGEFLRAEFLNKEQVIIPATEDSAGRTSGAAAHPLADKLHYCARDYAGGKENRFPLYEAELSGWCASQHAHPKACAVLDYVRKGTLARDLTDSGILQASSDGTLLTDAPEENPSPLFKVLIAKKVGGKTVKEQGDALVCWRVEIPGELEADTWKDKTMHQSWIAYDSSRMQEKNICMVNGNRLPVAGQHPRNIRRSGDGAKLISSNDTSGFTFRGKFEEASEACTVSYEISQMAHSALRWLIARQGYRNGDQAIVAWAVNGEAIPDPLGDAWLQEDQFPDEEFPDNDAPDHPEAPEERMESGPDHTRDAGASFADQLNRAFRGYKAKLEPTDEIVLLGLDSATPGRISVTFFRELAWFDYLGRLKKWQADFAWLLHRRVPQEKDGKRGFIGIRKVCAPGPEEICFAAYGGRADEKLKHATVERILPCIADASLLPRDLVESAVRRVCNRAGLERREWRTILGIACGLYRGYCARHLKPEKRRNYSMALDETINSRDYLFGRLLAVAEYVERNALDTAEEKRPTNAERLMQRFSDHPRSTWLTLEKQINPYMQRLQTNDRTRKTCFYCKKLLRNICDLFAPEDFASDTRLSGEFLLGYHCQMSALYTKHSSPETPSEAPKENAHEQPAKEN